MGGILAVVLETSLALERLLQSSIIHSLDLVNFSFNTYGDGESATSNGSLFCSLTLSEIPSLLNKNLPYSTFKT